MRRMFASVSVVGGVLFLLTLAACSLHDEPATVATATLQVSVTPDDAHVTVMTGPELVEYGYGDRVLAGLEPGAYRITVGHGPDLYTTSLELRAGERVTASFELAEATQMQLTYQRGPFPGPSEGGALAPLKYGPPPDAGGGGDGGHHGGGEQGNAGGKKGDVYGDLWVLDRNDDGSPTTGTVYDVNGDPHQCVQPISSDPDATGGEFVPMVVSLDGPEPKCEPAEGMEAYVTEVDFGRLNLVRSPSKVLDKAYDAAMTTLTSGTGITTDPAGRLAAVLDDGTVQVIDSPLENVALYRALMANGDGTLTAPDSTVVTLPNDLDGYAPTGFQPASWLDIAAALFAAGADKTGIIDVDEVVYINEFLGLNVDGYGHYNGYTYDRQPRFGSVDATLLLPTPGDPTTYTPQTVPIMDYVFDSYDPDLGTVPGAGANATGANARGFARAADDALQVIEFIHDYALP